MICEKCGRDVQPDWENYCPHFPKRLGLSGSGAKSCPADAKRGGQDVAEGRSREEGRVQSAAVQFSDGQIVRLYPRSTTPPAIGASGRLDELGMARRDGRSPCEEVLSPSPSPSC